LESWEPSQHLLDDRKNKENRGKTKKIFVEMAGRMTFRLQTELLPAF
jgi:hypothetical protein